MNTLERPAPDSLVVDWQAWPDGVDGMCTVEGMTVDEFKAIQVQHPELKILEMMDLLRQRGYKVEYFSRPE